MATIKSLRAEIEDLNSKAQSAQDEANRLRGGASNYAANGYPDKAESETKAALQRDKDAAEFTQKATDIQSELRKLEEQANVIRQSILDQQQQLTAITGE